MKGLLTHVVVGVFSDKYVWDCECMTESIETPSLQELITQMYRHVRDCPLTKRDRTARLVS